MAEQRSDRPVVVDRGELLVAHLDATRGGPRHRQIRRVDRRSAVGRLETDEPRARRGRGGRRREQRRSQRVCGAGWLAGLPRDEHRRRHGVDQGLQFVGLLGRPVARVPQSPLGRAPPVHLPREPERDEHEQHGATQVIARVNGDRVTGLDEQVVRGNRAGHRGREAAPQPAQPGGEHDAGDLHHERRLVAEQNVERHAHPARRGRREHPEQDARHRVRRTVGGHGQAGTSGRATSAHGLGRSAARNANVVLGVEMHEGPVARGAPKRISIVRGLTSTFRPSTCEMPGRPWG